MKIKALAEYLYWKMMFHKEKRFSNQHYKYFYSSYFDISESFYSGKTILDIGCGPRGSLNWAADDNDCFGLDPLKEKYEKFGISEHPMKYIKGYAENMPFSDQQFDLVSSFNSLDHVENIEQSAKEIYRVLKPGGLFLLIVNVHFMPTITEPNIIQWDLPDKHFSKFKQVFKRCLKASDKFKIYANLRMNITTDPEKTRNGVLVAKLRKL